MSNLTLEEENKIIDPKNELVDLEVDQGFDQLVKKEIVWLHDNPKSKIWNNIKESSTILNKKDNLVQEANNYLNYAKDKINLNFIGNESYFEAESRVSFNISKSMIEEVIVDLIGGLIQDIFHLSSQSIDILSRSILKGILDINDHNKRNLLLSGKLTLLRGVIEDLALGKSQLSNFQPPVNEPAYYKRIVKFDSLKKKSSLFSYFSTKEIKEPKYLFDNPLKSPINIFIQQNTFERKHLKGFSFGSKYDLKSKYGSISCVKTWTDRLNSSTILLIGTKTGRLLMYKVAWNVLIEPEFMGVSKRVGEIASPVTDIVFGHNGPVSIVTFHKKKHILAYHQVQMLPDEPVRKNGYFSCSFFFRSKNQMKFRIITKEIIYYANYTFPQLNKLNLEGSNRSSEILTSKLHSALGISNLQFRYPTTTSFIPIRNMINQPVSFLIGTSDGYIFKINDDFTQVPEPYYDLHPDNPSFITKEYVNPNEKVSKHLIIKSNDMKKKGNLVYREIFHYHRDSICFLASYKVDNRDIRIISIDDQGRIALWKYDEFYFQGSGWFIPMKASRIDKSYYEFESVDNLPKFSKINKKQQSKVFTKEKEDISKGSEEIKPDSLENDNQIDDNIKIDDQQTPESNISQVSQDNQGDLAEEEHQVDELISRLKFEKYSFPSSSSVNSLIENESVITTYYKHIFDNNSQLYCQYFHEDLLIQYRDSKFKTDNIPSSHQWKKRYSKRIAFTLQINQIYLSNDNLHLFILFNTNSTNTSKYILKTYNTETLLDDQPTVAFNLDPKETLLDLSFGPLMKESMTRIAFALTNHRLLIVSLLSGSCFTCDKLSLPSNHSFDQLTLCESFRLLTLWSSLNSSHLQTYHITHILDGKERIENISFGSQSFDPLLTQVAIETIFHIEGDGNSMTFQDFFDLVDDIIDESIQQSEDVQVWNNKARLIRDLYEGELGFIQPTKWPVS